jgi:hypothetical protein
MIDDRLDGQLLTLRRVVATAAPPRSEILAIVERNQVHRTRMRRVAGALAAVVVVGTGALFVTALDGDDRADVAAGPDIAGPDVAGPDANGSNSVDVADPEVGGEENQCGEGLAGPDPASEFLSDDLAVVGDALEAHFPSCFGGIVRTGPASADVYIVDMAPEVLELAQTMLGPGFDLTALPSDQAMADIKATKTQIDNDAGQLHTQGIPTYGTAIRIDAEGPRVLVGLSPYSADAASQLEELYGADALIIEEYGQVIPG